MLEHHRSVAELALVYSVPGLIDLIIDVVPLPSVGQTGEELLILRPKLGRYNTIYAIQWRYDGNLEELLVQLRRRQYFAAEGDGLVPVETNTARNGFPEIFSYLSPLHAAQRFIRKHQPA